MMAQGDRVVELAEVVELADAVATRDGIATGMGTHAYGVQIVVEADSSDEAVETAMEVFTEAARQAGLPPWPITKAETLPDEDDLDYDIAETPEGGSSGPAGPLE